MFQYTHELVFNSLKMEDGSDRLVRNGGSTGPLTVKRGGEYWKEFIKDQKVYRTDGNYGKYEILKIDVSKFMAAFPSSDASSTAPAYGHYAFTIFVKLLDPNAIYEFGYPNYTSFGRQILVGFEVRPGDTAATVAKSLYDALNLAAIKDELLVGGLDESGTEPKVVAFEDNATVIAIQAKHFALRFDSVGLSIYDETACDSCLGDYLPTVDVLNNDDAAKNAAEVVVDGVMPFATGSWLVENLRFPSYPNVRWAAIGEENRPTPGVLYTMFSFAYDSPRPQFGGMSGVGQKVEAVTRHIYYVPTSLADDFAAAFTDLGATVVATNTIQITDPDGNVVPGGNHNP